MRILKFSPDKSHSLCAHWLCSIVHCILQYIVYGIVKAYILTRWNEIQIRQQNLHENVLTNAIISSIQFSTTLLLKSMLPRSLSLIQTFIWTSSLSLSLSFCAFAWVFFAFMNLKYANCCVLISKKIHFKITF